MQDHLREIEGTLARAKERKSTILYKLAKRKSEEERLARLGLRRLPSNPLEVENVEVVKHVLFTLKQEIGDKTARIRNAALMSLEKDGESLVRAANDELNRLHVRRVQWERRLHVLKGDEWSPKLFKKTFWGCAKELPEAKQQAADVSNAADDELEEVMSHSEASEHLHEESKGVETVDDELYFTNVKRLFSREVDAELLGSEREAEASQRAESSSTPVARSAGAHGAVQYISTYCNNGVQDIPSEEFFAAELIEERKKSLQSRLASLREQAVADSEAAV